MKIIINIFVFILLIVSGFSQEANTQSKAKAEIMFDKSIHNFGKIEYGNEASFLFEFKNVGKKALVIQKVETSCGCTIADKPDQPIKPKETAYINVIYEADEVGKFQKSIKIYSNAVTSPYIVYIKGVVIKNN